MDNETLNTSKGLNSVVLTWYQTCLHPDFRLLQPIWDLRIGWEPWLASPLFPVVLGLGSFFGIMIPYMILDLYGKKWTWLKRYRLHDREVTMSMIRSAAWLNFQNLICYVLPSILAQWIWLSETVLPPLAPTCMEIYFHLGICFVIFDAQYGLWHICHHKNKWLYNNFHATHHQFHQVFCWSAQYLHPMELFTVGLFVTINPWFFNVHCMTYWIWMVTNNLAGIEAHSGYNLPFLPHNFLPFWGGAPKHDIHHLRPNSNFQPYFNTFDKLFGNYLATLELPRKKLSHHQD